jgi:hypothetical protein
LQNRLIQTSQTGGQWYSDTSPFSIPWFIHQSEFFQVWPDLDLLCVLDDRLDGGSFHQLDVLFILI